MTTTDTDQVRAEMDVRSLTVHECVARILADLPAIQKNGTAPANMGGYKFRRVEDITAALKPLFAQYGVLCLPSVMSRVESQRSTSKGGTLFCVDLEICFRFIGPQGDELATNVWGQGTDSGDKATQKAVTSAFKTMLSVVFCISDSEMDAEAHDVPETTPRPAPAPKARIDRVVDEIAAQPETMKMGDWVRNQGFEWPWTAEVCGVIEAKLKDAATKPEGWSAVSGGFVAPVEPVMSRAESLEADPQGDLAKRPCSDCGLLDGKHTDDCPAPF